MAARALAATRLDLTSGGCRGQRQEDPQLLQVRSEQGGGARVLGVGDLGTGE